MTQHTRKFQDHPDLSWHTNYSGRCSVVGGRCHKSGWLLHQEFHFELDFLLRRLLKQNWFMPVTRRTVQPIAAQSCSQVGGSVPVLLRLPPSPLHGYTPASSPSLQKAPNRHATSKSPSESGRQLVLHVVTRRKLQEAIGTRKIVFNEFLIKVLPLTRL